MEVIPEIKRKIKLIAAEVPKKELVGSWRHTSASRTLEAPHLRVQFLQYRKEASKMQHRPPTLTSGWRTSVLINALSYLRLLSESSQSNKMKKSVIAI